MVSCPGYTVIFVFVRFLFVFVRVPCQNPPPKQINQTVRIMLQLDLPMIIGRQWSRSIGLLVACAACGKCQTAEERIAVVRAVPQCLSQSGLSRRKVSL